MKQHSVPGLIEKLDTSSDKRAEQIIAKLAKVGKSAVPELLLAAKNPHQPKVRKWSLQALGVIGDQRAAPLLVKALKNERMTVRLHAIKGLSHMKYKPAAKKIAKMLSDESGGIRVNALFALEVLGEKSVLPQIRKCLSDQEWYVRQAAAEICGNFKDKKSLKTLMDLTEKDGRKAVVEAAKKAILQISP